MTNRFFFPRPRRSCLLSPAFSWLRGGGGGGLLLRPQLLRDFLFASYGSLSLCRTSMAEVSAARGRRGNPRFQRKTRPSTSSSSRSRGFRRGSSSWTRRCERVSPSHRPPSLDILNQTKRNSDPLRQRPVRRRQPRRRRRRRRVRAKGKREGEKRSDGLSERRQPGNSLF